MDMDKTNTIVELLTPKTAEWVRGFLDVLHGIANLFQILLKQLLIKSYLKYKKFGTLTVWKLLNILRMLYLLHLLYHILILGIHLYCNAMLVVMR